MQNLLKAASVALSLATAACAIHPLPEDVTGDNTALIVRKIRCEARDAVIRKTIAYLLYLPSASFPKAHALGEMYQNGRLIQTKDFSKIEPVAGSRLLFFAKTGVVYNFSFDITESNDHQFEGHAGMLISGGSFGLGGKLGATGERQNVRSFTITDSFGALVDQVLPSYCDFAAPGPNYLYPIVGRIGLAEMVDTFVDLTLFHGLSDPVEATKPQGAPAHRGPPTMADTLTFTTTLTASATPKIELAPLTKSFRLVDASLTSTNSRVDKHQVIVGFGLPSAPVAPSTSFTSSVITAKTNAGTGERAAADAVAQQIVRFELLNRRPIVTVQP